MPEKLSDNDPGAHAPNALEGVCPFRGNTVRMFVDGAGRRAICSGKAGRGNSRH